MLKRIGYPVLSRKTGLTTNRTFRLSSASPEKINETIAGNLSDLEEILKYNAGRGWRLFRVGSSVIPFASHPINTVSWRTEFATKLSEIGKYVKKTGLRLSMHPGQYTVLNSPKPTVVSNALKELEYSSQFLDAMNLGKSHKIVIHLGGVFGDKEKSTIRLIEQITSLNNRVHERLVIENDEVNYSPVDALRVAAATGIPVVFDNLHYSINPGNGPLEDILGQVFSTWSKQDGLPKVHFSSQAVGSRPGKHAEMANKKEFDLWIRRWSAIGDFDLMVEAKAKDIALDHLDIHL